MHFLIGKEVIHVSKGVGKVVDFAEKEDGVSGYIWVEFSGGTIKLQYPNAFGTFLRIDDVNSTMQIEADLYAVMNIKENRTSIETKKVGRSELDIDEYIAYPTIEKTLNECFGHRKWKPRTSYFKIDSEYYIWFPKMAIKEKNGYVSGDSNGEWLNILSGDGRTLVQKYADGRKITGITEVKEITFTKEGSGDYVFIGVFQANKEKCSDTEIVKDRIADRINLEKFQRIFAEK